MNELQKNGQSQSLFSTSRDEEHSLTQASSRQQAEKQARMRRFLIFGLPLCVLMLAGIVVFLWQPVKAIHESFKPSEPETPHDPFEEMRKQKNETQEQRDGRLGKWTVKGNPKAKFVIAIEAEDKSHLRQGHEEILNDAVNTKPSEILLKMRFAPGAGAYKITFNGEDKYELEQKDGTKVEFYLAEANEMQWAQAITDMFEKVYGPQINPLEPKISDELREYRSQPRPEPLPNVLPEVSTPTEETKPKPGYKSIVLPKPKFNIEQ